MKDLNFKKTIDWYEKNSTKYAFKSKGYPKIDFDQLSKFANLLPAGAKVLDAGCGSGRDSNLFQEKGFNITGLDLSKNLITEAKKSYPSVKFVIGDLLDLPFRNEEFDGVWAHASLVHFDNDLQFKKALSEIVRVLKKSGKIHILVRAKSEKTRIETNRHYKNYTIKEIKRHLYNINLKNLDIKQYNEEDLDPDKRPGEGIEWIIATAEK